jgi:hypothetical protein
MIVYPYKVKHGRKQIVFVDPEGQYVDEDGERLRPKTIVEDHSIRCFCTWETARKLTAEGQGEALLWNGEHIRWRPFKFHDEDEWHRRGYDAYVLRTPMYADNELNMRELVRWRDWLHQYKALPATMGGTSMSLLRARVTRPLFCSSQWDTSQLPQSAGGRITIGPQGRGTFIGRLVHWDMPAAYATEIGTMRYGGRWFPEPNTSTEWLDHLVEKGVPIYCRAKVYVPSSLPYGPLCRRYRQALHPLKAMLMLYGDQRYPTGKSLQGIWTWEELATAQKWGCSVTVIQAWHHAAKPTSPFAQWWEAVQEGRKMQGLAGSLAKTTGNALWGSFALDPATRGKRSIHSRHNGKFIVRHPVVPPRPINAIELAEIVAGRTRAKLYDAMMTLGDKLICAHTDGLWSFDDGTDLGDKWRIKKNADRIQLLSPQHLRYSWHGRSEILYSGVPAERAEDAFNNAWGTYLESEGQNVEAA